MAESNQIVHEAEVQRQHVRLQVPVKIKIGGEEVEAHDWSVSGLSVHVPVSPPQENTRHSGVMIFEFGDFNMSIDFEAEVRHVSQISVSGGTSNRVGMEFVNMSMRQTSLLRYVASAYIAGEVVSSGDVLTVVQRDNSASERASKRLAQVDLSVTQRVWYAVRGPVFWLVLAAILLLAFVITSDAFYRQAFVNELATAEVMTDTPTARAPVAGVITFIGGKVGDVVPTGEPLLGVRRPTGDEIFVDSPCDCTIMAVERQVREFIDSGEVALRMLHPESKTFVRLYVSKSNAQWLFDNEPDALVARVLNAAGSFNLDIGQSRFDAPRDMIVLDLVPREEMPSELAGRPATVTMEAARTSLYGRIRAWIRG